MKVALVTGASGGIGKAIVKRLIVDGYFVIGQYNQNKSAIENLIEELKVENLAEQFYPLQADFACSDSIKSACQNVKSSFKHIDLLVNNAGKGLYKLITQTTEQEWDNIFAVNMKSTYLITNFVLETMIDNKKGKIINVSSMWGNVGASMEVAYSASKSAMIGYTKALAKEVAPCGINVNCICPGVIDTPINARFSNQDMLELKEQTPLGRIGTPMDVAELVAFLADDKSSFITGQIITCDGGFTL